MKRARTSWSPSTGLGISAGQWTSCLPRSTFPSNYRALSSRARSYHALSYHALRYCALSYWLGNLSGAMDKLFTMQYFFPQRTAPVVAVPLVTMPLVTMPLVTGLGSSAGQWTSALPWSTLNIMIAAAVPYPHIRTSAIVSFIIFTFFLPRVKITPFVRLYMAPHFFSKRLTR